MKKDMINSNNLVEITTSLSIKDRLRFITENEDKLLVPMDFIAILTFVSLEKGERLQFAIKHKETLKGYDFTDLFETFFEQSDKLALALEYIKMTRKDSNIGLKLKNYCDQLNMKDEDELQKIKYAVLMAVVNYGNWSNDKRNIHYREKAGTFFSSIRHGREGQEKAHRLLNEIKDLDSDEQVIEKLSDLLSAPNTRFHHHSFASFLLDELKKSQVSQFSQLPDATSKPYDRQTVINALSSDGNTTRSGPQK